MRNSVKVELRGAPELRAQTKQAEENIKTNLMRNLMYAGFMFEAKAKWYASGNAGGPNIDTGMLRNSIQTTPEPPSRVVVGPHTDYAIYLEYGTVHMRARPFMRPAFETTRDEAEKFLRERIGRDFGELASLLCAQLPRSF